MIRLSALALAAGLAVTGASLAHADSAMTGKWNYKVGADDACTLTLSSGDRETAGSIAPDANCPGGLTTIAQWRAVGRNLNLLSSSGNLVAVLHPKGDGYTGEQIGGGRKVALSR